MDEFILEDWEWPEGVSRHFTLEPRVCEVRWPDGLKKTLICAVSEGERLEYSLPLFRQLPTAGEAVSPHNYIHIRPEDFFDKAWLCFLSTKKIQQEIAQYFRPDFELNPHRIFHIHHRRGLVQGRLGFWCYNPDPDTRFRLPFESESRSGTEIFQWLDAQLNDTRSETSFASRWYGKKPEEEIAYFEESIPRQHELRPLLKLIALAENDASEEYNWYPGLEWGGSCLRPKFQRVTPTPPPHESERLGLWSTILKREFPRFPLDPTTTPLYVLDSYRAYYENRMYVRCM